MLNKNDFDFLFFLQSAVPYLLGILMTAPKSYPTLTISTFQ